MGPTHAPQSKPAVPKPATLLTHWLSQVAAQEEMKALPPCVLQSLKFGDAFNIIFRETSSRTDPRWEGSFLCFGTSSNGFKWAAQTCSWGKEESSVHPLKSIYVWIATKYSSDCVLCTTGLTVYARCHCWDINPQVVQISKPASHEPFRWMGRVGASNFPRLIELSTSSQSTYRGKHKGNKELNTPKLFTSGHSHAHAVLMQCSHKWRPSLIPSSCFPFERYPTVNYITG